MTEFEEMTALTRRRLLKAAMSGAMLTTLPAWFAEDAQARLLEMAPPKRKPIGPNDTIGVAVIGPGGSRGGYRQGLWDTKGVAAQPGVKIVAVCDVDDQHAEEASREFGAVPKFRDFRELLARPDVDAVVIGTPDHWHATIASAAMKAGKDVYCEKPLTLYINEGIALVKLARRHDTVFQVGSQQRSDGRFRLACELVRNGRIGKLKTVEAHLPTGPKGGPFAPKPVPEGFDWQLWLGPAPEVEYLSERTHGNFRWWYDYSGGMVTDWGAHHLDIAQWGLGRDKSGPIRVEAKGESPLADATGHSYTTHPAFDITYTYDDGVTLFCTNKGENGVLFTGEAGWIFVSRERIGASDPNFLQDPLPADALRLYNSPGHQRDWVEAIRARKRPVCDVEVGHRSVTLCHLGTTSLRLGGRALAWDPKRERFADKEADAMRARPTRGWKV